MRASLKTLKRLLLEFEPPTLLPALACVLPLSRIGCTTRRAYRALGDACRPLDFVYPMMPSTPSSSIPIDSGSGTLATVSGD